MQRLPQEIYDQIEELVFSFDEHDITNLSPTTVIIEQGYAPPGRTQVDRHSRAITIRAFYGNTRFSVSDLQDLEQWLDSLSEEAFLGVRAVHFAQSAESLYRQLQEPILCCADSPDDFGHVPCTLMWWRAEHYERPDDQTEARVALDAGHTRLINFFIRVEELRQCPTIAISSPFSTDVNLTFMDEDEWEKKEEQDRARDHFVTSQTAPAPMIASLGRRVYVDYSYQAPHASDFEWNADLHSSYYRDTYFTVYDRTALDGMLEQLSPPQILEIRRIHIMQRHYDFALASFEALSVAPDADALFTLWSRLRQAYDRGGEDPAQHFLEILKARESLEQFGRLAPGLDGLRTGKQQKPAHLWMPRLEMTFDGEGADRRDERVAREQKRLKEDQNFLASQEKVKLGNVHGCSSAACSAHHLPSKSDSSQNTSRQAQLACAFGVFEPVDQAFTATGLQQSLRSDFDANDFNETDSKDRDLELAQRHERWYQLGKANSAEQEPPAKQTLNPDRSEQLRIDFYEAATGNPWPFPTYQESYRNFQDQEALEAMIFESRIEAHEVAFGHTYYPLLPTAEEVRKIEVREEARYAEDRRLRIAKFEVATGEKFVPRFLTEEDVWRVQNERRVIHLKEEMRREDDEKAWDSNLRKSEVVMDADAAQSEEFDWLTGEKEGSDGNKAGEAEKAREVDRLVILPCRMCGGEI